MVFEINPGGLRSWSHADTLLLPLTYRAMDLVTQEILNPQEPKRLVDSNGNLIGVTARTKQTIMVDAQMECLESMARRVVGALCYAGLLVAVVAEEIVRIALAFAVLPFTLPLLAWQECEESWAMFCVAQVVVGVLCLIDAPVRTISALVQKCLTDQTNWMGNRKEWHELNIC
ncbi:MAG: hypothetical protein HYX48_05750 [Chlamydiales bacterium]|nr:hypothetical protein [Chlamydiales bacterium]